MGPWLVVWFVVGIVSTVAVLACLIGLLRHLLVLGRTVKQLQEEVQPIADDLARERQRASAHVAAIGERGGEAPPAGPGGRIAWGAGPTRHMLNIGPQELLIVLIIALVVVGPQRLPELGRTIGKALREFRKIQDDVKDTLKFDLNERSRALRAADAEAAATRGGRER